MTAAQPEIIPEDSSQVKRWNFARWFSRFVWAYFVFVVVILFIAFILLLFNASTDVGFVEWVYRSSERAMEPFRGIFPTESVEGGSVVDFSILFAIMIYGIIASLIDALVHFIDRNIAKSRSEASYIAQESVRRSERAMALDASRSAADYQASQDAAAAQLAVEQAAAQQRTAAAAEHLAEGYQQPPI